MMFMKDCNRIMNFLLIFVYINFFYLLMCCVIVILIFYCMCMFIDIIIDRRKIWLNDLCECMDIFK